LKPGFKTIPDVNIIPDFLNNAYRLMKSMELSKRIESCYNNLMDQKKTKNEISPEKAHDSEVTYRILIPVLATAAVCLGAFVFLLLGESSPWQSTAQWANISIMFLILPCTLIGLIIFAVLILLAILSGKWNRNLPTPLKNIRLRLIGWNAAIQRLAQKPANWMISIKSLFAGLKSTFRK
jgi:hypothetical protein